MNCYNGSTTTILLFLPFIPQRLQDYYMNSVSNKECPCFLTSLKTTDGFSIILVSRYVFIGHFSPISNIFLDQLISKVTLKWGFPLISLEPRNMVSELLMNVRLDYSIVLDASTFCPQDHEAVLDLS